MCSGERLKLGSFKDCDTCTSAWRIHVQEVVTINFRLAQGFDFSEFLGDDDEDGDDAPRGAETRLSLRLRLIVVFDLWQMQVMRRKYKWSMLLVTGKIRDRLGGQIVGSTHMLFVASLCFMF